VHKLVTTDNANINIDFNENSRYYFIVFGFWNSLLKFCQRKKLCEKWQNFLFVIVLYLSHCEI